MPTFREVRQSKGWSQQELASRARLGITTVSRVETGHTVSKNTAQRLCDVLGVQLEEITGINYHVRVK